MKIVNDVRFYTYYNVEFVHPLYFDCKIHLEIAFFFISLHRNDVVKMVAQDLCILAFVALVMQT